MIIPIRLIPITNAFSICFFLKSTTVIMLQLQKACKTIIGEAINVKILCEFFFAYKFTA